MARKLSTFSRSSQQRKSASPKAPAPAVHTELLEERRLLSVSLVSDNLASTAGGNGFSGESSVSSDGRFVAFRSAASDLTSGDNNATSDVYLRDRQNNSTRLISVNTGGSASGNGYSAEPSVSADGRYVAFSSLASDLVSGDTNNASDIFVRDMTLNTTTLVSVKSTGSGPGNGLSAETFISADGRFVAFTSAASDLVAGDTNARADIFLRNLTTNTTTMVSVNSAGTAGGNQRSFDPSVSSDGRFVGFSSSASDIVTGDTNSVSDVFLRDMSTSTTTLVSINSGGTGAGNGGSLSSSVSSDGQSVVFRSAASNLVAGDGNGKDDVFLRDTQAGTTTLLSVNQQRTGSGNGASAEPSVSQDGHFAAFSSTSSDLVTGDGNGVSDIFLRDLRTGAMTLLSVNSAATSANGASIDPFVSTDGKFVAFTSSGNDLTSNSVSGAGDVFVAAAPKPEDDTVNPTAAVSSSQASPATGSPTYDFTVDYSDNIALNTNSFSDGDVTVLLANGTTQTASFVGSLGSGKNATATYRINAPGGALDPGDDGLYTVTMLPGTVTDAADHAVAAGNIGSFTLAVAPGAGPDLIATIASPLPGAVVGGSKGAARIRVTNQGNQIASGNVGISLFVSADGTLSAGKKFVAGATVNNPTVSAASADTLITTVTKKMKLKPGQSKLVSVKFLYPAVSDADYRLLAQVDPALLIAEGNEANNVGVSSSAVTIAAPFVDLSGVVTTPITGTLAAGQKTKTSITITNNGNVTASGLVDVALSGSTDQVLDAGDKLLALLGVKVKLKAGKSKKFNLKLTLPADMPAGSFFTAADIDSSNHLAESNDSNNTAVGATQFQVA